MTRTALVLAVLLASTFQASAFNIVSSCSFGRHFASCAAYTVPSPAEPAPLTPAEIEVRAQHEAAWTAFCKPVATVDALGVSRYSYAHEGCENGRTQ